jgi:hypothetical protein
VIDCRGIIGRDRGDGNGPLYEGRAEEQLLADVVHGGIAGGIIKRLGFLHVHAGMSPGLVGVKHLRRYRDRCYIDRQTACPIETRLRI